MRLFLFKSVSEKNINRILVSTTHEVDEDGDYELNYKMFKHTHGSSYIWEFELSSGKVVQLNKRKLNV